MLMFRLLLCRDSGWLRLSVVWLAVGSRALWAGDGDGAEPTLFPESQYGSLDYYRFRHDDFLRRNPASVPPDYYLAYGDKYLRRFTFKTRPILSDPGQLWLDRTGVLLQVFLEDEIRAGSAEFARLEMDADALRAFAFATHPDAYWDAGLADLPVQDLMFIFLTPDIEDLLSDEGRQQTREILSRLKVDWAEKSMDDPEFLAQKAEELVAALRNPLLRRAIQHRYAELQLYLQQQGLGGPRRQQAIDDFWAPLDLPLTLSVHTDRPGGR